MIALLDDFRDAVDSAVPRLERISDARAGHRPAPTTWSAKEVLGHLIDSAANNHSRFVLAQGRDDLSFPGYDQERWVEVQAHGDQPWPDLIGTTCGRSGNERRGKRRDVVVSGDCKLKSYRPADRRAGTG
jgi:hypothetical protein